MKKLLAVILTLAMIFSMSVTSVFAEEDTDDTDSPDVPIEQAAAGENGFADFDLDPSHYASAAAFANAVLSEAETYGQTKKALALLQTACAIWPNPRFTAAEDRLIRRQWKEVYDYHYTGNDNSCIWYTKSQYDTAGDQISKTWYYSSEDFDPEYSFYSDGEVISGFYTSDILYQGYDENHRLCICKGVNGWRPNGCEDVEEMNLRLYMSTTDHQNRYEYNEMGRMTADYYRLSDDPEFLSKLYTYDASGTRLLETSSFYYGECSGGHIYEYDEDGSLIKDTEYSPDGEVLNTITYTYDKYGQKIREEAKNDDILWVTEYQYWDNGQLKSSVYTGYEEKGNGDAYVSEHTFDEYGNMLTETRDGLLTSESVYEYNDAGLAVRKETFFFSDEEARCSDGYDLFEYTCYLLPGQDEMSAPSEIRGEGYCYILKKDGTAKITDCCLGSYSEDYAEQYLAIPEMLDGFPVTELGENAFFSYRNIIELTIPDTVTLIETNSFSSCYSLTAFHVSLEHPILAEINGVLFSKEDKRLIAYPAGKTDTVCEIPKGIRIIGDKAFYRCSNLTDVIIPETVVTVGDCAFWGCGNLTEITLPDSVTELINTPFFACENLRAVLVSPDHPVLSSEDGVLFNKQDKTLICYPCAKEDTYYDVPDGTLAIGYAAFCDCDHLMEITVPDSVTEIGEAAFAELAGPVVVDLGNGITVISDDAFKFSGVTKVTLPSGLKQIGEDAFSDSGISNITFPDGLETIGSGAFWGCHKLEKVDIPDSVTEIAEYAFGWCSGLTELKLPAGLSEISPAAFSSCSSLTNIDLPDTVKVIGEGAFSGCGLTSIDIPDSVTELGSYAFSGCSFTSVALPEGITEIGEETFQSCSDLTEVILPDGLTRIGSSAFAYCYALTDLVLPESVTEIGEEAFYLCQSLSGIEIPDNVTRIRERTFQGCESLRNIVFPEGLVSIEHGAFWDCVSLGTVTIPESVSFIDDRVFSGCGDITLIVERDSYALEYCLEQGLNYLYSDSLDWLNN